MSEAYWGSRFGDLDRTPGLKRPRAEYDPLTAGRDIPPPYVPREDLRFEERRRLLRETDPLGPAFDRYLRNGVSSYPSSNAAGDLVRGPASAVDRIGGRGNPPLDSALGLGYRESRVRDSLRRSDEYLAPEASSTLFVEGLPADCTRREAAHIFRPFVGFKEVRLVNKESKAKGGEHLVLCFVDFTNPSCAATAMDALQGYRLDEKDSDSPRLKIQFSRYPSRKRQW
eukprot:TRINITY_DN35782_c0_g1_i1.p1 TRINITY_DN35782_c0_g1~~TRINITY_DN35782_c0_g1_i1.p1  ORF type:complete len:227 (-),score=17.91 TRINITY_DN35782_c0_g1_i1:337-1017(-)